MVPYSNTFIPTGNPVFLCSSYISKIISYTSYPELEAKTFGTTNKD